MVVEMEDDEEEDTDSSNDEDEYYEFQIKPKGKVEALNRWQKVLKLAATAKNDHYMNTLVEEFIKSLNNNKVKQLHKDFRNARDIHGNALVHYLAKNSFQICIQNRNIVDLKSDLNLEGYNAMAPVHFAARYGIEKITTEHLVTMILNNMDNPVQQDKFGNTVLHHSIFNGDSEIRGALAVLLVHIEIVVGSVIKRKFQFNDFMKTPNFEHYDGLHLATEKGYTEVIDVLMREGKAEAKYLNKQKMNPLHIAVNENNADCVEMILNLTIAGKNGYEDLNVILNQEDEKGNPPLCIAIEKKYDNIVQLLLDKQKEVGFQRGEGYMNFCGMHGNTQIMADLYGYFKLTDNGCVNVDHPLHFAIEANNKEVVELLIEIGADINRNIAGKIAVELAIEKGHAEIVDILLEHRQLNWKAISSKKNERQNNLLHYAARSENSLVLEGVINFLMNKKSSLCTKMMIGKDYEEGNSPLHIACKYSSFLKEEVEKFVGIYRKENIRIHQMRNANGQTPLHLAAISGNIHFIKELCTIQFDSDNTGIDEELLKVTDVNGNKAVHCAASFNHPEILEFLLTSSEDHKPANSSGKTPLHCASESGSLECMESIIKHVQLKNKKLKIEKVINFNRKDHQGNTSLLLAVENGRTNVAQGLMKAGADISPVDLIGRNALELAIEKGNKAVVETIIESNSWQDAFRAANTINSSIQGVPLLGTPMRSLIYSFPDLASKLLDKCYKEENFPAENKKNEYYNFEFLDDTFQYGLYEKSYIHIREYRKMHDSDNRKKVSVQDDIFFPDPYISGDKLVSNHPLMMINDSKGADLLNHRVVCKLISYKWKSFGRFYFALNLLYYVVFLGLLTTYIHTDQSRDPTKYPDLLQCSDYFQNHSQNLNASYIFPEAGAENKKSSSLYSTLEVMILSLCIIRFVSMIVGHENKLFLSMIRNSFGFAFNSLLKKTDTFKRTSSNTTFWNLLKSLFPQNWFYFLLKQEWPYIFDVTVYIMSLVVIDPFNHLTVEIPFNGFTLSLRTCAHWQLSAGTVTLAWINLLFYMRHSESTVGKYINILADVIYNFISFAVVLSIFVLAFAYGFSILLQNQDTFQSLPNSFMKTLIMMSGEFEYGDIFFPDDEYGSVPYPYMTYSMFVVFFILVSLILINLLVGLTVNDVAILSEAAELKQKEMRIKFILNMEDYQRKLSNLLTYFGSERKLYTILHYTDELQIGDIKSKIKQKMWSDIVIEKRNDDDMKKQEQIILRMENLEKRTLEIEKKNGSHGDNN